ncbi:cell surface protein [Pararcticibacter amylolyticus]|uniref:cell surface protein n=1 Tax=Pararcticibacter amylolyticus TaxID=2173175 RepID=UPI001EE4663B|nr:cell surface protein [Pararcticibacter amylolyticus]
MRTQYNTHRKITALVIAFSTLFVFSCKKDKEQDGLDKIDISASAQGDIALGDTVLFKVKAPQGLTYKGVWKVNDETVSEADSLVLLKYKAGTYAVEYVASAEGSSSSKKITVNVLPKTTPVSEANKMYVSSLFEYLPAPGQYINVNVGNLESAAGILGKRGTVTLGAWGGYIVLGFDHKVPNVAGKEDIIIYNNAGLISEPGVVWVMEDQNGNGKPDDTWYELKGSASAMAGYVRNYSVTYTRPNPITGDVPWKDNKGNTGVVKTNSYHPQTYFPLWISGNEYTLTGTSLPSVNINMSNPSYITSSPFEYGYADNAREGFDKLDISNAIDASGNSVNLQGIHFIKIQTGIQANMGWLGELSTEVLGVADASLVK